MNEAFHAAGSRLTTSDLASHPDFTLGLAAVSPSTRSIAGPGGAEDVEPRVMQVLVVLAEAAGRVVTRETLFERCWGGVYVGDDSLNRAIAAIRKLASSIGADSFTIETIPRTGYRLVGARATPLADTSEPVTASAHRYSRREIAGGALGVAALGSIGAWAAISSRQQRQFDLLVAQGAKLISDAAVYDPTASASALERAVQLRPESPAAWGWLAYARSVLASQASPKDSIAAVDSAQQAIRRALSLNPQEPNALLAMFALQGSTLDWWTRDRKLRQIIAIDPVNVNAIAELVLMLQAAGLNRESWNWNERAIQLQPLSQDFLGKRALKLWIAGRVAQADKVIDQVRALYPTEAWPWWVRFLLFATTGRPQAARTMLDSNGHMMPDSEEAKMWRPALDALETRSVAAIARARQACVEAAKTIDQTRGQAVMILSALEDLDTAFQVAEGFLLGRGPIVRREQPGSNAAAQDAMARVNMQWLFTPPCAPMRSDPRFLPLCEGIGLTEYWRRRGVRPDYQLTDR